TPGSISKPPVVKALPTVRDHTTDQLGPEGDEYIPREIDEAGETKVSKDGYPLGERKYRCRTFNVPNRGEKLFMLATECA
ncbi:UNVERIFIED_CONTAM: chromatin structure-remodeling complex subunit RSC7, partial [Bacteroidetes bacterium 56_B9]